MENTIRLYRVLLGSRAYLRSLSEGASLSRRQHHRDLRRGQLCHGPRQQLRHRFRAEPRRALQRTLSVHLRNVHGVRHYRGPAGVAAEPAAIRAQGHGAVLLVRAVFVALTHMAPSPIDPQKPAPFFNSIFYGSDLFFSGHTGLPFLAALAFWHIPQWRIFYLALTAFFGSVVLLGHYHYSIDVLAALFITHGIFQTSCWLFGRDYTLFRSSESLAAPRPKQASRKTLDPAEASAGVRPGRSCCTSSEMKRRRPPIESRMNHPASGRACPGYPLRLPACRAFTKRQIAASSHVRSRQIRHGYDWFRFHSL